MYADWDLGNNKTISIGSQCSNGKFVNYGPTISTIQSNDLLGIAIEVDRVRWFHNGVRLRVCHFMFINLEDSRTFCSIYHMGDEYRPSMCSGYIPRHETCTSNKLDFPPWESC